MPSNREDKREFITNAGSVKSGMEIRSNIFWLKVTSVTYLENGKCEIWSEGLWGGAAIVKKVTDSVRVREIK